MTNGYIVLTKGEPNLYKHAIEAITLGKPIYYADGNKVAFVNSIELVSTNVVIKTSDKQITVASDGTESESTIILLNALMFDSNDLNLTGATQSNNAYYTLLTSTNAVKLSELPDGKYSVIQGVVEVSGADKNILYLEVNENRYSFYLASDDIIDFTIQTDSEADVINI